MATTPRQRLRTLSEQLVEHPQRFEFFRAVWQLEQLLPERAPVGRGGDPRPETVRFRSHVSLRFPVGEIHAVRIPDGNTPSARRTRAPQSAIDTGVFHDRRPRSREQAELDVNFLGIACPHAIGSLPIAYTELLLEELREGRTALRDFLDLFNHRFISLFYRSWIRTRVAIPATSRHERFFERALFGIIGLGFPALRGRQAVPDARLLARAGLLLRRPASAAAIEALVRSYFGVPVRIVPFVAKRSRLDPGDLTRLGRANATLGRDILMGSRVRLRNACFRLVLGPLDRDAFESFQSHGSAHIPLYQVVRFAISSELEFEVQLELQACHVPRTRLCGARSRTALSDPGTRLGRSTWLLRGPSASNRTDAQMSSARGLRFRGTDCPQTPDDSDEEVPAWDSISAL